MRRKAAGSLKKKTDGFTNPDPPSTSRDLKRRRSVTFVDVDPHRSHSPEAQTGSSVDAKTSEFAFFNKLKSSFGLSSSEASNKLKQNPKDFESRGQIHNDAGTDRRAKDIIGNTTTCTFSTPIFNATRGSPLNLTRKDKDPGKKCSSGFNRDKDRVQGDNNNLSCRGSSDEKEDDFFSLKRKRLNQWVKHTWFPDIPNLTSNGGDLVSLLLTRLFPGTDEKHPSRFSKERTYRGTFLDSPGSKFLKRSHESYTEVDRGLQMEKKRAISWPENSIATNHVHCSCIPRDPQDFNFPFSYPREPVYRPPLLTQEASLSFPVEETLDSSFHFRNYKSLSLGYHGEEDIGYSSEAINSWHLLWSPDHSQSKRRNSRKSKEGTRT